MLTCIVVVGVNRRDEKHYEQVDYMTSRPHEKYCSSNPTDLIGFFATRSEMTPTDTKQFLILAS